MATGDEVSVRIDAGRRLGRVEQVWNWFGYDEPNYTDTANGKTLIGSLASLGGAAPRIRTHNLLTSGDGVPALKWGSTDAYRETASGEPEYFWRIMDRLFDTWVEAGAIPFIQAGFMPQPLSGDPGPYRHEFSIDSPYKTITTGWATPPNDLSKWSGLIAAWAQHLVDRYGASRVRDWPWEFWNEPDGFYWTGTIPQFYATYAATADAIRAVIPEARIGGPHTCGPHRNAKAETFLREFLETWIAAPRGTAPALDFVAFHAKGKPEVHDGHVRMGLATHLNNIRDGIAIANSYPALDGLPIIVGESDPEGCAACPASLYPQNAYRNGPLYGIYVIEATMRALEIARQSGRRIEGLVTWAFLFEDQPWFAGFRDLATNGVDKAVLNCFRLLGMLQGDYVDCASSGRLPLSDVLENGVRAAADIDAVATSDKSGISILCWNYHDDDVAGPDAALALDISGVPAPSRIRRFSVDATHSNAYGTWQQMGEPQNMNASQLTRLHDAARLAESAAPDLTWNDGRLSGLISLPRQAATLIRLEF